MLVSSIRKVGNKRCLVSAGRNVLQNTELKLGKEIQAVFISRKNFYREVDEVLGRVRLLRKRLYQKKTLKC
jgi:hypothetical protein